MKEKQKQKILLVLWLTRRCNLHCIYCYADAGRENKKDLDMETETALRAVRRFRKYPLIIQFSGGEPLLAWETIKDVVRYVQENGIEAEFRIQTNGSCIRDEHADFIKEHRISVGISMDGIPSVNEITRGKTAETVRGIRILGKHGIRVNLNAVVTVKNVELLPQLVDFAWYLESVNGIGLDLLRAAGRGRDDFNKICAPAGKIADVLSLMQERCTRLEKLSGRKIVLREIEDAKKRMKLGKKISYCYASCGRAVAVLPDGCCYPCGSLAGNPAFLLGNIHAGLKIKGLQQRTQVDGNGRSDCFSCKYRELCPGGCPSRLILNEDIEPDCALRKAAFEIVEKSDV